jgi:uncharacterized protein Yka (UPF0111/DUF47 family)
VRVLRRETDTGVFDLFEESARNMQRTTLLLRDLLRDHPDRAELSRALYACEQEGDRITHDIIHRLSTGDRGRPPLDPADGHALATALDDVVDYAEQTGDWLGLYAIEAPMEQALLMAEILVYVSEHVARALRALRTGAEVAPHLVEIKRLENEGDRVQRDAVASLFANGIDPMVVIRWKDIFASLEAAVDACETVAHIVEGIVLKRGRRP